MNYQVNDYGLLKKQHLVIKQSMIFFKITKKIGLEKININKNKYYKRFFITNPIF